MEIYETVEELEEAINSPDEEMQDYLDSNFAYLMFNLDNGSTPTWNEALAGKLFEPAYWMLEGVIDHGINGEYEFDADFILCQYQDGRYEPYDLGDIIIINNCKYRYISSIELSEEMEYQSDDGGFAYEYRGFSFVRILEPIEKIIQDFYPTFYGGITLAKSLERIH